jgi:hypothetical protein
MIQEYPKAKNVDTMVLLRAFYNQVSLWYRITITVGRFSQNAYSCVLARFHGFV